MILPRTTVVSLLVVGFQHRVDRAGLSQDEQTPGRRNGETDRWAERERQTDRQMDREGGTDRWAERERQTDRWTELERQTDRQMNRDEGRQ